jgi:3-hydroxyisobutyrate dehydrogenase-like beta-hydroxyacid dehydrogenase
MVPFMYSVLFIGKGVITTSLEKSLDKCIWRAHHYRREVEDFNAINLSTYDYVVSCLPDAEVATKAWDDILFSAINSKAQNTKFIDISSLTREAIITINKAFCREKLTFIEAPFTGSKTGALNGRLVYFASSETVTPETDIFLKCTSSKIYRFDNVGAPTQFKLFYNLWGLTSLGLLGQMLEILNSIPQKELAFEILTSNQEFWMGAIAKQKLLQCLSRKYEDLHCKLIYAKKDIKYAIDEFSDCKLELSRCLLSVLEENWSEEYADLDFTAMCEFFR